MRPSPSSTLRHWALVLSMIVLTHPGIVLALIALSLAFVLHWWFLTVSAVWIAIPLVGSFVHRDDLPGRAVRPGDEPELAALVSRVADALTFRAPLLIRVIPVVDAALTRSRIAGHKGYMLLLGWPLIRELTEAQLAAVVTHELSHEQHVRGRRDRWMIGARNALVESLGDKLRFPAFVKRPLLARTQKACWVSEFEADADAVRVVGTDAARGALERIELMDAIWAWLGDQWVTTLAEDETHPIDFYPALHAAGDDPYVARRARETARLAERWDDVGVASHPRVVDRINALLADAPTVRFSSEPLTFRASADVETWCTHALFDVTDEGAGVRVLDDTARFEPDLSRSRERVVAVTGRDRWQAALPDAIDQLVAEPSRLGERLDPDLARIPEPPRREVEQDSAALCIGAVLATGLMESGWTRVSPWTSSVLRDPAGVEYDLVDLSRNAATSGDPAELLNLASRAIGGTA